ncbi:MAG: cytochrome C oxidase subunit IV family protein [Bryobacteraceae bacterium]
MAVTITDMHEHIDSVKTYTIVFVALLILTLLTTVVATVDLGQFNIVVALVIAVVKMLLVALFFMHLRHSTILTKVVVGGGLLWLGILLLLGLSDFVSRGWLPVPGK